MFSARGHRALVLKLSFAKNKCRSRAFRSTGFWRPESRTVPTKESSHSGPDGSVAIFQQRVD